MCVDNQKFDHHEIYEKERGGYQIHKKRVKH